MAVWRASWKSGVDHGPGYINITHHRAHHPSRAGGGPSFNVQLSAQWGIQISYWKKLRMSIDGKTSAGRCAYRRPATCQFTVTKARAEEVQAAITH